MPRSFTVANQNTQVLARVNDLKDCVCLCWYSSHLRDPVCSLTLWELVSMCVCVSPSSSLICTLVLGSDNLSVHTNTQLYQHHTA